jgi:hypothetical protein
MKHVASSTMLSSTKTECKKRLLEILLSNNLNLLVLICQSPLISETGSTLHKSILKLLMAYQSEEVESFIVRLLSYKARMFHIKNRDACDILRDNSFLSMFLNAYAHEIGYRYLTSTLNNSIKEILHYAKNLELDPNLIKNQIMEDQFMNQNQVRSAPVKELSSHSFRNEPLTAVQTSDGFDMDEEDIEIQTRRIINNNIAKIENICLTLLNTIINNKEKMPKTLHHLCYSIANVIEASYNQKVENTEVKMADLYYVGRQTSDLSMFNILNYENCKTPTELCKSIMDYCKTPTDDCKTPIDESKTVIDENNKTPNDDFYTNIISASPLSSTPLSLTPKSACNFLDDKDSSIYDNYSLDTQNIYNQSIYSSNATDKGDKAITRSNGSISSASYSISTSPSRFSHNKFESYTSGIAYNSNYYGFNQLKSFSPSLSCASNLNLDSEEGSISGSNKIINMNMKSPNQGKETTPSKDSNSISIEHEELKSDDDCSSHTAEKKSLKDHDKKHKRRFNLFNNGFKGFKFHNQEENKHVSNGENDSTISPVNKEEGNSLKNENHSKSKYSGANFMAKEDSQSISEYYLELDFGNEESLFDHFNERNGFTIEEEEEDFFNEERINNNESSLNDEIKKNKENQNSVQYYVTLKDDSDNQNQNQNQNNNEKGKGKESKVLKTEVINNSIKDNSKKSINKEQTNNNINLNEIGRVDVINPIYLYDELDTDCNETNGDIEYQLEKLDIKEIYTVNEETINNKAIRFNNKTFLKEFLKKDNFQIKEIKSGTIVSIKNSLKTSNNKDEVPDRCVIVNEEERGKAIDLDTVNDFLLSFRDPSSTVDSSRDSGFSNNKDSNRNIQHYHKINESDSYVNITNSLYNKNQSRLSARSNYLRNNSEILLDSKRYGENILNHISDEDINYSHSKQVSMSSLVSLSQRKNELGLKIETSYDKLSQKSKNNNNRKLYDNYGPKPDNNSNSNNNNKYREFVSATVKGNPKAVDIKQPNSSTDNDENRYFVSLNDLDESSENRKSKLEKQGSGYFLTSVIDYSNSEKVVGTFLFLRFFVPAITSPENFGLTKNKISISERKSLIICGKVLTALCNNVNFGGKEKYMEFLNPFLQVHREETKEFLQWAMQYDENENEIITPFSAIINDDFVNNSLLLPQKSKKDDYDSEYSSDNSSYNSINIQEQNSIYEERGKQKNELIFSKKKNLKNHLIYSYDDGSHFNSMPILTIESNSSSMEQISNKDKGYKSKENISNSKSSVFHKRQNLKLGSVRVKNNITDQAKNNNMRSINPTEIKKDYETEVRDVITFLTKNIHLLEKEIESKTSVLPPNECEGVFSGLLELKQIIILFEDNNTMKNWFKKIFRTKYSNSMENLPIQKSTSKSRRSSNNSVLLKSNANVAS